jgi:DNA sulfur modification protein DndB
MIAETRYSFAPMLCPAMRARMGDRWYYFATMTFAEVARSVQPVPQLPADAKLKIWIQRKLRPERTEQIASYLCTQKQRFFNSLVLGMWGGDPEWQAVEVEETVKIKNLELDDRQANAFGMIHLSGEENIFAIDGQHRVEGIRAAVAKDKKIGSEEQAVIFIAHHETEQGRERTRRLFATLNSYARPITELETVAISEDDAFAIATRRLIDNYRGLDGDQVLVWPTTNIPVRDKTAITTVVSLYQMTKQVAPPEIRKVKKKLETGPSDEDAVARIVIATSEFWDALKKKVKPVREVCSSKVNDAVAGKYRHANGGHLLFRPKGMEAFARAARILMDRGATADDAIGTLAKVSLELDSTLWRDVFWQAQTKKMLHKYVRLAINVFLQQVGASPATKGYSVADEFLKITGREYPA